MLLFLIFISDNFKSADKVFKFQGLTLIGDKGARKAAEYLMLVAYDHLKVHAGASIDDRLKYGFKTSVRRIHGPFIDKEIFTLIVLGDIILF